MALELQVESLQLELDQYKEFQNLKKDNDNL
jgi:hypothetical protein